VLDLKSFVIDCQKLPRGDELGSPHEGQSVIIVHRHQTPGGQNIGVGLALICRQVDSTQ